MQLNDQSSQNPIRPQNKSCPAGGTNQEKQKPNGPVGQGGMIIASPSPNTFPQEPLVVHRGFDTLALSVKSTLPKDVFDHLILAKADAEEAGADVLTAWGKVQLHVKSYGGKGYALITDGGPMGATWFFKKPNGKDPWGIRVSFGSDFLATNGLGAAKAHLERVLSEFGITYGDADVSISRADYCVDILAPDFVLEPDNFVLSARTSRKDFYDFQQMPVHGTSGRVNSITVGSIKNRQVIIYDKRAEVITHNKRHWWVIWQDGLNKMYEKGHIGQPIELNPSILNQSRIFRIEFRAGKTALKEKWNITTWADFFDRFGDLCRQMGEAIRYCDPIPNDSKRARWPNHALWDIAVAEMNDDLFEMRSGVDPILIKEVHKETHISVILRGLSGCALTYAALNGREFTELDASLDELKAEIGALWAKSPEKIRRQLSATKDKYTFITATNNGQ
uniref:hypothetical protein n=1 Tax=Yoonia sp. TaxID=2212373 RepID=UPI004047A874